MKSFLRKPVQLYIVLPVFVLSVLISYLIATSKNTKTISQPVVVQQASDCSVAMLRKGGFQFTNPLLMTERNSESAYLQSMKSKIETYIQGIQSGQRVQNVSVYFRRLKDGDFFAINPDQVYNPASMAKVIFLITYLKEADSHPEVMNRKIFFSKHFEGGNKPNIGDFHLAEDSYYTVRQLLEFMIRYSDNDATLLLSSAMNQAIYEQLFVDLKIKAADTKTAAEYFISVTDYSKFFRLLYNSTYFKPALSEYGLKLLTMSTYNDGIRKGIDPGIPVAHKFGERVMNNISQLHEFGIVYINQDPYLIGVMSTGTNLKDLSEIMGEISRIANQEYKTFIQG